MGKAAGDLLVLLDRPVQIARRIQQLRKLFAEDPIMRSILDQFAILIDGLLCGQRESTTRTTQLPQP